MKISTSDKSQLCVATLLKTEKDDNTEQHSEKIQVKKDIKETKI